MTHTSKLLTEVIKTLLGSRVDIIFTVQGLTAYSLVFGGPILCRKQGTFTLLNSTPI